MKSTLSFLQPPSLISLLLLAGNALGAPTQQSGAPPAKTFRLRIVPAAEAGIDLEHMSFASVKALIERVQAEGAQADGTQGGGEIVLPLPFATDAKFPPIEIRECLAEIDPVKSTLVVGGSARVGQYGAKVFLSGTYSGSGPGQYAYGLRPDELKIGNWIPPLSATPLGTITYEELGFVIASAPLELPVSQLVSDILGIKDPKEKLEIKAGVTVRSTLAVQSVPIVRDLLAGLGIEEAHLKLSSHVGTTVDFLVAAPAKKPMPLDLAFHAELEASSMKGLRSQLPAWIQPTSLTPSIDLELTEKTGKPTELGAEVAFDAKVALGGESMNVKFTTKLDAEADLKTAKTEAKSDTKTDTKAAASTDPKLKKTTVVFIGEINDWVHPLGIDWLTLKKSALTLTVDNTSPDAAKKEKGKESGSAKLASTIKIGSKEAKLSLELKADKADTVDPSATLTAGLDSLTVGDLADFVSTCTGSSFLSDLELGNAAQLAGMEMELACSKKKNELTNELTLTATVGIGGAQADVLFMASAKKKLADKSKPAPANAGKDKKDVDIDALFAIRRRGGHLSDLAPDLAGQGTDMEVPDSVWTLTSLSEKDKTATLKKISSADLKPVARKFFEPVYGTGAFDVELTPGIRFGARIPVAKMPPALVKALDISDTSASLLLEGSLDMKLDLKSGKPSAAVKALELHAELPRVAGAGTKLPEGLPAWMRMESSSQRTLTLRYAAPSSVTFSRTNDVLADIDGATRHFKLATEVSADAKQGSIALSGKMVGEWKAPFGLEGLNLRDVTISAAASAQTGQGGKRAGGVTLDGGFDLGSKHGRMTLELAAESGAGMQGAFTGTLDSFALEDLMRMDLFPGLPKPGIERLKATLGTLPPLEKPTLHVELGNGKPAVSFTADTSLNGTRTHLLVFVTKGASGPQAVFGIRPESLALSKLFPRLSQNPSVAAIADLPLEHFGLLAVLGDQTLVAADVPPNVREFFVAMTGEDDFKLALSQGLNLEARVPTDKLPPELKQTLDRLKEKMGQDSPASGLALRGTIAATPADLQLVAALPPLTPGRGPKWIKSGQLSFVVTGAPSFMIAAVLVVDCDGDLLNLSVEGGMERQGANVAIALKSALQAEATWKSPFGMDWLEIRRFSGQLSIDALGNVGLGGGGNVTIGQKDIQVFAWTKINAVTFVPVGLVVEAKSKAGFGLTDLAALQCSMRKAAGVSGAPLLPLDQLPDISLRDAEFKIATRAIPEENIAPGFILKGDLYMPKTPGGPGEKFAFIDCEVGKEGIVAKGSINALELGPLSWDDSTFDLEVSPAGQHLRVHGSTRFLGASSKTDLTLERSGLSFETTREIRELGSTKMLVEAAFDLKNPKFHVRGELTNEFGKQLEDSALGEFMDVRGRVAKRRQVLLGAVQDAKKQKDALFAALKLPTAEDRLDKIDADLADYKKRMAAAKVELDAAKKAMDQAYKAWNDAPKPAPKLGLEHVAAKAKHDSLYAVYYVGPLSWTVMLDSKKRWRETIAGVVERQHAFDVMVAQAKQTEDKIANYHGKTWVVQKITIDSSLTGLIDLKDGMPVDMTLDLAFCGEPHTVKFPWVIGKPGVNVKTVVQTVIPTFTSIANEG